MALSSGPVSRPEKPVPEAILTVAVAACPADCVKP
jgi:hypothetical protein